MDPGGIIGVVSLTIQVCQSLSKYYGHFTAFDSNIAEILNRIELLNGTLAGLEGPIRKLDLDNNTISEQVRITVTSCKEALGKLRLLVEQCSKFHIPGTNQSRLRLVKERAMFPFRKGTLDEMSSNVSNIQASLDTILSVLQLDTAIRFDERAEKRAIFIQDQNDQSKNRQIHELELLQSIQELTLSHSQQTQSSSIQSQGNFEDLSSRMETMERQMSHMAHYLQMHKFPAPSVMKEGLESHAALIQPVRKLRKRQIKCSCTQTSPALSTPFYNAFGLYWRRNSGHRRSCLCSGASSRTDTFGAYLTVYGKCMKKFIQASITSHQGAGGMSISFTLYTSRYMHGYHPSHEYFSFDRNLCKRLSHLAGGRDRVLSYIQRQMDTLFRCGRAHRLDRFEGGATYLHMACRFISWKEVHENHSVGDMRTFLQYFIDAGIPVYEEGESESPLDLIIRGAWDTNTEAQQYLANFLAERGAQWAAGWIEWDVYIPNRPDEQTMAKFLANGSIREAYNRNPLEVAIVQQSSVELRTLLRYERSMITDESDIGRLFILSANWPEGLQLLLQTYKYGALGIRFEGATLRKAFMCNHNESVTLLLDAGFKISDLLVFWTWIYEDTDIQQRVLDRLTHSASKCSLSLVGINRIFCNPKVSFDSATKLYDAGFQDIDTELVHLDSTETPTTLLWEQAQNLLVQFQTSHFVDKMMLLRWLEMKGARIDCVHPDLGSTPAHLICTGLSFFFLRSGEDVDAMESLRETSLHEFYAKVFAKNCPDRCHCACSSHGGCLPIACAAKFLIWEQCIYYQMIWSDNPPSLGDINSSWPMVLDHLTMFMEPIVTQQPQLGLAVLRVLAFGRLGIRHTCHDESLFRTDWRTRGTPMPEEEVREIHDEDSALIEKLDTLMIEYEEKWTEFEGTFQEFVNGYFHDRMEEVLGEMDEVTEEHVRAIEDLGVVLQEAYGPIPPPGLRE